MSVSTSHEAAFDRTSSTQRPVKTVDTTIVENLATALRQTGNTVGEMLASCNGGAIEDAFSPISEIHWRGLLLALGWDVTDVEEIDGRDFETLRHPNGDECSEFIFVDGETLIGDIDEALEDMRRDDADRFESQFADHRFDLARSCGR